MILQGSIHSIAGVIFLLYLVTAVLSLIFFSSRVAKIVLINSLIVLLIFSSNVIKFPLLYSSGQYTYTEIAGLLVFPFSYSLMLGLFYNINSEIKYFYLYLGLILSTSFILLAPERLVIIISLYYIFFTFFLFFIVKKITRSSSQKILHLFHFFFVVNNLIILKNNDKNHLLFSIPLFLFAVCFLLIREYRAKFFHMLKQMGNTSELNRKLTHQISRLKQSNEQFRKIIADKDTELYQLSRHASLAEVTTGIAHELAQPLTGIKGIAQNMVDDLNYDDFDKLQAASELQKISSLVDKSSSIIDHIRNFSKKTNFSMKLIDINSSILEAVDLVNYQLRKKNIELVCSLGNDLPFIFGDTISIEQLIVNIILNAKDAIIEKSTHKDKFEGLITVKTSLDKEEIILMIQDNGIGIPKDIIPKIWSPFFTSKKRNYGTGVGLSISSKIIKEHNGRVYLSTSGEGTTFSIHFKIAD